MRILIIANYKEGVGGISGQVSLLYNNLRRRNVDVSLYSTRGNALKRLFTPLLLLFKGVKYDIFHIHACSNLGFFPAVIGIIIGKLLRKKIILTYHGGGAEKFFDKRKRLVSLFLAKTDFNIVLSGFLAKIFDKHSIPYVVIPNIMDLEVMEPRVRGVINPIFISVRTLTPLYNIPCIIRAFEIVVDKIKEARLMILADGCSRAELEAMVSSRNIPNVIFVGRVPNKEINTYLNQADIFISSPIIDNQPMSVLEGFNAGTLVISSNVGGVPYLVEDGITGLLFESDNHVQLSEKMIWTVNNSDQSFNIIQNAKLEVKKYSSDNIIPKIIKLYEGLCR